MVIQIMFGENADAIIPADVMAPLNTMTGITENR